MTSDRAIATALLLSARKLMRIFMHVLRERYLLQRAFRTGVRRNDWPASSLLISSPNITFCNTVKCGKELYC